MLDDLKEEQGTDEFKKHATIRKADYKEIREFVIEKVGNPKKVTKEDLKEAVDFFYGKKESKESREKLPNRAVWTWYEIVRNELHKLYKDDNEELEKQLKKLANFEIRNEKLIDKEAKREYFFLSARPDGVDIIKESHDSVTKFTDYGIKETLEQKPNVHIHDKFLIDWVAGSNIKTVVNDLIAKMPWYSWNKEGTRFLLQLLWGWRKIWGAYLRAAGKKWYVTSAQMLLWVGVKPAKDSSHPNKKPRIAYISNWDYEEYSTEETGENKKSIVAIPFLCWRDL